ncbi:MAG TPA: xanthine dehydrogenase family protein molybdopterin-binding subunit [Polyangiales bacterium]|nr:xanthine dehydrogenase family protein molybdopterin-binding subunit [Polyangiales bacterium]
MPPDASQGGMNRRDFLKAASATGLLIAVQLPLPRKLHAAPAASGFTANAFVQVTSDNWVIVTVKHHEMGQGATTGIATCVAEELDADWARVRAEYAPSDATKYNNLLWGPVQGTGGSSAMRAGYEQMRKAGATARAMLVQAAAQTWKVPAAEIATSKNTLTHRSGKKATYGEMALAASKLPVPADVKLKDPAKFALIGKETTRRLDSVSKTNGTALYTIDVKLPGLLTAVVLRPPAFAAKLKNFDASAAKKIPGVTDVVEIPEGVAVVATSMWSALRGRDAVKANWDTSKSQKLSSEQLFTDYKALTNKPGSVAVKSDKTDSELAKAAKRVEAVYEFPFLAHATMEPMNCVAWLRDGQLETWAGHQVQTLDHMMAAQAAGLTPDKVKLNTLVSGGSFGRRANYFADYTVEAVHVAKAINGKAPVRVQATRESDLRAGLYRPQFVHSVKAGIDAQGNIVGWQHRIVGQSIMTGGPQAAMVKNGIDPSSVEGVWPTPYVIPNISVELHSPEVPVRPLWWRSVGHTHTGYVMETMLDELATLAGRDPVEFRLELLKGKQRHTSALKLAAEKAGWGKPLAAGMARGLAVHESFETVVAQVVEVSLTANGQPRVHRVVVGVDCGLAINPDVVRAQMEGGVGFALSAALYSEIQIERGEVVQSNYHDYKVLRIDDMPKVEVYIVPSKAEPTGVGEPGVPPLAPAVANAVYQLTGQRVRRLPFARHQLKPKA